MRSILIAAAACMLFAASVPAGAAANYSCDGIACECEPDDAGGSSSQDCQNMKGACSGDIHCWCGWAVCTCACWKKQGAAMTSGPYSPVRGGTRQLEPGLLEGGGGTIAPQGPGPTGPAPPPRAPAGRIN